MPGAGTVRFGKNSHGKTVELKPRLLTVPYDLSHKHIAFTEEFDDGKLDGFDEVASACKHGVVCPPKAIRAYGYVPKEEVKPYWIMAEQYAFANLKFSENVFGLPLPGTTDVRSDDLLDCFDFLPKPRKFQPIPAPLNEDYSLREPIWQQSPDDDF